MAKLNAAARNAIPSSDFAVAGRKFPIENKSHARNALARASGKPVESEVRAKVHAKYPDIGKAGDPPKKSGRKAKRSKIKSMAKKLMGGAKSFPPHNKPLRNPNPPVMTPDDEVGDPDASSGAGTDYNSY